MHWDGQLSYSILTYILNGTFRNVLSFSGTVPCRRRNSCVLAAALTVCLLCNSAGQAHLVGQHDLGHDVTVVGVGVLDVRVCLLQFRLAELDDGS